MINENQLKFIEEYVLKGKTGKSNKTIAQELGISERTAQRYLENDEVKKEINRRCASTLDTFLPQMVSNAEEMLNSTNPNTKAKGQDIVLKLWEKAKIQDELTVIDREKILIQKFIESCVNNSLFLKNIDSRLFLEVCISQFTQAILLKGYETPPMTAREIEEYINQAVAYQEMLNRENI